MIGELKKATAFFEEVNARLEPLTRQIIEAIGVDKHMPEAMERAPGRWASASHFPVSDRHRASDSTDTLQPMTYDPNTLPRGDVRLPAEAAILYEDSELPRIAIAPAHFTVPMATMWVRSRSELMMLHDGDGHWVLVFMAANNSVQLESPAFWRLTDVHHAARKMRKWLDDQGLILPEDLDED